MPRLGWVVLVSTAAGLAACSVLVDLSPLSSSSDGSSDAQPDAGACDAAPNDPHNCGVCGHDCLGGACAQNACQPVVIAQYQDGGLPAAQPEGLFLTSTALYVGLVGKGTANTGAIVRMNLDGSNLTTLVPTATYPRNVVATSANILWVEEVPNGHVMIAGLDGSNAQPLASGAWQPFDVRADSSYAYWTTIEGDIFSCPLTGCTTPTALCKTMGNRSLALDGTELFFTDFAGNAVYAVPTIGGLPVTLATAQQGAQGIAVDAVNVYWTNYGGNSVMQCRKSSCTSTTITLATSQSGADGIAVDGQKAYWANESGGTVASCTMGTSCGQSPQYVSNLQSYPLAVAVDAVAIYWTDSGGAMVMRLAK